MGQYSWLYSDNGKQMIDNKRANSYLLVPPPFQQKYGKWIKEDCYDGYGHFDRYDIYELIIEWNKEFIPDVINEIVSGKWKCSTSKADVINLERYSKGEDISCELRWLGIVIACYDEDNERLMYPIKITSVPMEYDEARISLGDPDQGWEIVEDDDDEEEEW